TLVATDDGRHLAIVDGGVAPAGVEVEAVHVLDAGDGHLIGTVPAPPALTTAVAVVAAVPGRDALALLQRYRHEVHGDRFAAVTVVDLAGGGVIDTLDVARTALGDRYEATRDLAPSTLACGPDLTVALAPHDDHFDGGGLRTSSVRGLVTTPADWHQPDRPRVRARAAARAARDGR
ncbi:MAG: hypothetical protein KC464_03090, partial [Myxococcales bacterium]|nr:hypothetical protein [Myxococcales bacterium]